VSQIRLQPVVVQNVTTYGTVITVPNTELKLKPGMTANVKIEVAKKSDVLRVPNAALRFRPSTDVFAALNQAVPPEVQFAGGRGNRGGRGAGGSSGSQGASGSQGSPAAAPPAAQNQTASPAGEGRGAGSGQAGGRGGFGGGDPAERQARMMERFKTMSPDEQKQFIARMKDRGQDTAAFERAMAPEKPAGKGGNSVASMIKPKYGTVQNAQTIDALFAPLPPVESRGRAWVFMDHQLKPVNLRLGITDGTNTELLSGELQQNMEVVTGVTGLGTTRTQPQNNNGNPLMPGGRGPGGFGGGRGPGGR